MFSKLFAISSCIASMINIASSCDCSETTTNYESVTISNLQMVEYASGIYVYDFTGEWSVVEDECWNNAQYFKKDVENNIYGDDEEFILVKESDRWIIRKTPYTAWWAYCNEKTTEVTECNEFKIYEVGQWVEDSASVSGSLNDDCNDDDDDDDDDSDRSGTDTQTVNEDVTTDDVIECEYYDCIELSNFDNDYLNGQWQPTGNCYNNEAIYMSLMSSNNDDNGVKLLYYDNGNNNGLSINGWYIADAVGTTSLDEVINMCNEDNFNTCMSSGNWYDNNGNQDKNAKITENNEDDCSDAADEYYNNLSELYSDSESESDNNGELQWWAWLVIILSILVVIGIIGGTIIYKRNNNYKYSINKYKSDKNSEKLLSSDMDQNNTNNNAV